MVIGFANMLLVQLDRAVVIDAVVECLQLLQDKASGTDSRSQASSRHTSVVYSPRLLVNRSNSRLMADGHPKNLV